jgi:hypothetical protein
MSIPKLYYRFDCREVPSVQGTVSSATLFGTSQSTTSYQEVSGHVQEMFRAARAAIRPKPQYFSKDMFHDLEGLGSGRTKSDFERFLDEITGERTLDMATKKDFGELFSQFKSTPRTQEGLDIRLEGRDECYFAGNVFYRVDRGENVVLYLPEIPQFGSLGEITNQKNFSLGDLIAKKKVVAGIQVVDGDNVLFSHVINPDTFEFKEDVAPKAEKKGE